MAFNIKILDCTLRDGGYNNDWEFGNSSLLNVYSRIANSGVDIIETGFIDDRRPFDRNRSIFPDTESVSKIYGCTKKKPDMVVAMIDYGTCCLENIQPCDESFLDGIRVIFKKHRMHEAMEYCRSLKKLGYKVFSQLVSITSYNDYELKELCDLASDVKPYAVGIVDTYGLLYPSDLTHYYEILEKNLNQNIGIGFHSHNNLQLAYANSITFIERTIKYKESGSQRTVIADGTLYGMGKNAGNVPIELLSKYMNENYGCNYKIEQMLMAIEESIVPEYKKNQWGYKIPLFMSSDNKCHPSYVTFFEKKGNLSEARINMLLKKIDIDDKKLLYDEQYAEMLYQNYLSENFNDEEQMNKLEKLVDGRQVMIIGPGKNIKLQHTKVQDYINNKNPFKISINYIPPETDVDYIFVTKTERYKKMTSGLYDNCNIGLICTSNVEAESNRGLLVFQRVPLLDPTEDISDNSLFMLLKILRKINVHELAFAGLDGYSEKEDNYFQADMEYRFIKSMAVNLNLKIREKLASEYSDMKIEYITYSHYMIEDDINSAGF